MTFSPPDNALGAELLWWREDGNRHTLVTIAGPLLAPRMDARGVVLTFALHDVEGRFVTSWTHELGAEETLHVDSRSVSSDVARGGAEGALVIWVTPLGERPAFAEEYSRALTMVDWFSEQGELVTLHADQSVVLASRPVELTEIVFLAMHTVLSVLRGWYWVPSSLGLLFALEHALRAPSRPLGLVRAESSARPRARRARSRRGRHDRLRRTRRAGADRLRRRPAGSGDVRLAAAHARAEWSHALHLRQPCF